MSLCDSDTDETSLELRRALSAMANETLPDCYHHLLLRTGRPIEAILTAAVKQRCDLIILSHENSLTLSANGKQLRIKSLLKESPIPVLLIPDTPDLDTGKDSAAGLPSKTIVHLHPDEKNRLCSAFAMRCARLMRAPTVLTAQCKPAKKSATLEYMGFIRDRYWPVNTRIACEIRCETGKTANLKDMTAAAGADLTILTCNDPGQKRRKQYLDQVKPLINDPDQLVLWVQRHDWVTDLEKRMLSVYNSLSEFDLARSRRDPSAEETTASDDSQITLVPSDTRHFMDSGSSLLLGYYSIDGLVDVFQRYGLFRSFARRGYPDACVVFGTTDRQMERLRVFPTCKKEGEPLVDLVFRRELVIPPEILPDGRLPEAFPEDLGPFLYIEWLCLQDPERTYRDLEIPLPGQKYPGLGLGWKVMIILKLLACRIGAAGVYNMPEYYHTARLYHRYFHYIDPMLEGRLLALDRDTFPSHLVDTSWAFLNGLVMEHDAPCQWIGGPQILPIHPALIQYFQTDTYVSATHAHMNRMQFRLDRDRMQSMMSDGRLYRDPGDQGAQN